MELQEPKNDEERTHFLVPVQTGTGTDGDPYVQTLAEVCINGDGTMFLRAPKPEQVQE